MSFRCIFVAIRSLSVIYSGGHAKHSSLPFEKLRKSCPLVVNPLRNPHHLAYIRLFFINKTQTSFLQGIFGQGLSFKAYLPKLASPPTSI